MTEGGDGGEQVVTEMSSGGGSRAVFSLEAAGCSLTPAAVDSCIQVGRSPPDAGREGTEEVTTLPRGKVPRSRAPTLN